MFDDISSRIATDWIEAAGFSKHERMMTKVQQQSEKQHKEDAQAKKKYVSRVSSLLGRVVKPGSQAWLIESRVKKELPGSSKVVEKKRRNLWVKYAKKSSEIIDFTEYIGGPKRAIGAALYIVRDVIWGSMKLSEGKKKAQVMAQKYFVEKSISESRQVFEDVGIGEDLLKFLPSNLTVEVNPSRHLIGLVEKFGNKTKSWMSKAKRIDFILDNFNDIVSEVKADMRSGNEVTKLCAIMAAIAIETGLRPGKVGNSAAIKNSETGEKEDIDTFGITTMQKNHIQFVRDNFAEIGFAGKKGTFNTAELTNSELINELRKLSSVTTPEGVNKDFLFVTKDGQDVTYADLFKYMQGKWKFITPTDFRKLKSTQVLYDAIKNNLAALKAELIDELKIRGKIVKKSLVKKLIKLVDEALEKSRSKLSHQDVVTTVKSYIDPRVILAFLSRGGLDSSLKHLLLGGEPIVVQFDVEKFISGILDKEKLASQIVEIKQKSSVMSETAQDVLKEVDEMIDFFEF